MTGAAIYTCSICNEPSADICVKCTKDACRNHRCERCKACSDCCECEVPLTGWEPEVPEPIAETTAHVPAEAESAEIEPSLPASQEPVPEQDFEIPPEPATEPRQETEPPPPEL